MSALTPDDKTEAGMNWEDVVMFLESIDLAALMQRVEEIPLAVIAGAVVVLAVLVWLLRRRRRRARNHAVASSETREAVLRDLQTMHRRESLHAIDDPEPPRKTPPPPRVAPSPPRAAPSPPVASPPAEPESPARQDAARDEPFPPVAGAPEVLQPAGLRSELAQLRAAHAVMKEELRTLRDEIEALKRAAISARQPPPSVTKPPPSPRRDDAPPDIPAPGSRESRLSAFTDEDPSIRRARAAIEALVRQEREERGNG